MKVCDKTCIFCFFPISNKYLCMAKHSLLSERPSYLDGQTDRNMLRSCHFLQMFCKVPRNVFCQISNLCYENRYCGRFDSFCCYKWEMVGVSVLTGRR